MGGAGQVALAPPGSSYAFPSLLFNDGALERWWSPGVNVKHSLRTDSAALHYSSTVRGSLNGPLTISGVGGGISPVDPLLRPISKYQP